MRTTRRNFLQHVTGGTSAAWLATHLAGAEESALKLRLSACDWSLRAKGAEGMETAKRVGLDGLEVSAGTPQDKLEISDPALRKEYKENVKKTGVVVSSVALGLMNGSPFATDSRAPAWVEQSIEATKDLGAEIILMAFFGKGDLKTKEGLKKAEVDATVERLKALVPKAEAAGVILGLENTLSGKDNLAILDRVQSNAVRVYYDIGNSTNGGYDVPAEIRDLRDRICQIHFKDGGKFLGEGRVKMEPVAEAIKAINYKGWIVLETAVPTKDRDADFKRNAAYTRELLGMA
jgi:L-ribulose-5-phosphate 3-epimerase